jgi:hypothetical protein
MTDQIQNRAPRHAGHTREFPLLDYTPKHDAEAKPVNAHLLADGSKTNYWPVQDPNPTGKFNALRPHVPHPQPNVVVEEPKQDRLTLRSAAIYLTALLALVVVVAVAGVAVTR